MTDDWDDNGGPATATAFAPDFNSGRGFSRGRGFIPSSSDKEMNDFSKYGSNDDGFDGGRGRGVGGRRGGGGRGRGDERRDGFRGGRNEDDYGGGYRGRQNYDGGSNDNDFERGGRGRGGGGGGRGGFRGGRNDENGGGYRGGRNDDGEEGGFRGRRNDGGDRGFRGNRNDGDGGGYRERSNDDNGGGYRERRNDDNGGGYRERRNDDNGGGYRERRNDNNGGGYRERRNDDNGGGFRERRNDDNGGGYRERRNDDNGGGYRERRNDNNGGGFRERRNDDNGGGYRERRNDDNGGGFRERRNDDNGGGFRERRNDDNGGGFRERRNDDNGPRGGRRTGDDDGNSERHGEEGDGDKEQRPKVELYIPPDPTDDEESMFTAGISSGINFDKYDNIKVNVSGENAPKPIDSFETSGLRQYVLENVNKSGYLKPTPIQKHAIPIVMAGRDLMACAQTGSGKTAAFLLPIINILLKDKCDLVLTAEHSEPQAVIISPTRELALQIFNEARKFALGSLIKTVVAYGGTAAYHQAQQVMKGCHVLVGTPGRLLDFLNRGRITFSSLRFMVLDEADRMLDLGFMPDVEKMMNHPTMVPTGERQTLMFSATFPEEIQRLAGTFLHDYLFVTVGIVGGACRDVEQNFHKVSRFEKRPKLLDLLNDRGTEKTLVFVEMKRTADFIAAYLSEQNIPTTSIHGDRLQREREEALADFKCGRMDILVATAVAARGLDIKNVAHVVNYDLPQTIDEYVHRIGRTGRVGNRGRATSFYDPEVDQPIARDLVRILTQAEQPVPDFLEGDAQSGGGGGRPRGGGGFGGRDFRRFDGENRGGGGGGGSPQPAEEEEW